MSKELSPKYNPAEVEAGRYQKWLDEDVFKPSGDQKAKPYSIVIPPPNVTGKLHLGHAWDTTLQDIIIRQKRMQGFDTLWLPGMDHAGIATQAKVEERLRGEDISRYDLGREKFLDKVWEWKDEYAATIKEQWGKMGISVDYSRERFTLDEGLSKAVRKVFVELYKKGWIYRGEFIINWDPKARTALSDIEVIHKDVEGAFYHMNYMLEDGSRSLEVATTRPETMFGDTAVAVNPEDPRYKDLIGKNVILPIVNKPIPIVGDEHASEKAQPDQYQRQLKGAVGAGQQCPSQSIKKALPPQPGHDRHQGKQNRQRAQVDVAEILRIRRNKEGGDNGQHSGCGEDRFLLNELFE